MSSPQDRKLILILGGARSGKSTTAERMARDLGGDDVLYVATAEAWDDEMRARITEHQRARPDHWRTLEVPLNVAARLREVEIPRVVLLDCITLLASNVLLTLPEDCDQETANKALLGEIEPLLALFQTGYAIWIIVSNEVGMGIVPPYQLGRRFRDTLGLANQRLARAADEVILMVAGLPWHLKKS